MKKTLLLWIAAVVITIGAAVYQRVTGPSYPVTGEAKIGVISLPFTLPRTNSSSSDLQIEINTGKLPLTGKVTWKRFNTDDKYSAIFMKKEGDLLNAYLPKQPPAGKLQYSVILIDENSLEYNLTEDPVIIRFKGDVPSLILIPHIFIMFFAMLLSTRTGLEIFDNRIKLKSLTLWTLVFVFLGGMILGPITQLYAFGALWTGFPFGTDLTDNKTLIAFIGWVIAAIAVHKFKHPERWALAASIILLLIFLIPHSMFGSELDYSKEQNKNLMKTLSINNHR